MSIQFQIKLKSMFGCIKDIPKPAGYIEALAQVNYQVLEDQKLVRIEWMAIQGANQNEAVSSGPFHVNSWYNTSCRFLWR